MFLLTDNTAECILNRLSRFPREKRKDSKPSRTNRKQDKIGKKRSSSGTSNNIKWEKLNDYIDIFHMPCRYISAIPGG